MLEKLIILLFTHEPLLISEYINVLLYLNIKILFYFNSNVYLADHGLMSNEITNARMNVEWAMRWT